MMKRILGYPYVKFMSYYRLLKFQHNYAYKKTSHMETIAIRKKNHKEPQNTNKK